MGDSGERGTSHHSMSDSEAYGPLSLSSTSLIITRSSDAIISFPLGMATDVEEEIEFFFFLFLLFAVGLVGILLKKELLVKFCSSRLEEQNKKKEPGLNLW
eukprot:PhM_4_TR4669/c0_g2_i1/m.35328